MVKSGKHEYTVWPKEEEFFVSETEATENGIYIRLERDDVYSVGWYFENKSGGMTDADGTALEVGKNIAYVNLSYDPQSPVLTATLTADARIYVNGIEPDEPAVPAVYAPILKQYHVVHLAGELDIYITDSNGTKVYEGHNPEIFTDHSSPIQNRKGFLKSGGVTIYSLIVNRAGIDLNSLYPLLAGAMILGIGQIICFWAHGGFQNIEYRNLHNSSYLVIAKK